MLGARLADLRKDRGITQKELSFVLNVESDTISRYENDKISPSDETKLEIAKFFHVSLDYLMGLTREQHPYVDDSRMALFPDCFEAEDAEMAHAFLAFLKERRINKMQTNNRKPF